MKKRTIFIIILASLLGYFASIKFFDIYKLIKKYPNEFSQSNSFSIFLFYNTYRTLSIGDKMVKRGYLNPEYCIKSTHYIDSKNQSCINNAKLTNFNINCKETYETDTCENDGIITEFTYTGNRNQKCVVAKYNNNFALKPYPSLRETYSSESWYPKSIFDSPECEPTTK